MLISEETDKLLYDLHQKISDTRPSEKEMAQHACFIAGTLVHTDIGCYHEMKTIPMLKMCTSAWFPLLNRRRRNGLSISAILHRKDMAICSVPKTIRFG